MELQFILLLVSNCLPHETDDYIIKYFQEIYGVFNSSLNGKQYKIGVYGPRQICIALADKMLTTSSFVSDMSSGFTGNCGYPLPEKTGHLINFLKLHLPLLHHLQLIKLPVL